jgi:hypothetical protein
MKQRHVNPAVFNVLEVMRKAYARVIYDSLEADIMDEQRTVEREMEVLLKQSVGNLKRKRTEGEYEEQSSALKKLHEESDNMRKHVVVMTDEDALDSQEGLNAMLRGL